jgi:acyl carrier protein
MKNQQEIIIIEINKILKKYKKKFNNKIIKQKLLNNLIDSLDFMNFISKIEKKLKIKFKSNELDVDLSLESIFKKIDKMK